MVDAWNITILQPLVATVSGTGATLPANLLTYQPGEKASFGVGTVTQIYDLGSSKPVQQIALLYTNMGSGDSVRLTASDNPDGLTGASVDSGVFSMDAVALARPEGYRHAFYHRTAGPANARYVRVSVTSAGAATTAGRLVVGEPFQPEFNAVYGETAWGYEEADGGELLDSGVEVLYEMDPAPFLQFTLDALTEDELNEYVEPLGRLQHLGVPVLVARRPDPFPHRHNALFYGVLRMKAPAAVDYDTFEAQFSVRSML